MKADAGKLPVIELDDGHEVSPEGRVQGTPQVLAFPLPSSPSREEVGGDRSPLIRTLPDHVLSRDLLDRVVLDDEMSDAVEDRPAIVDLDPPVPMGAVAVKDVGTGIDALPREDLDHL